MSPAASIAEADRTWLPAGAALSAAPARRLSASATEQRAQVGDFGGLQAGDDVLCELNCITIEPVVMNAPGKPVLARL